MTAPAFQAIGASAADADPHAATLAVTPPAHVANDILLLGVLVRGQTDSVSVTSTGGGTWTAMTGSPFDRSTVSRYWFFWLRATSAAETASVAFTGTAGDAYAWIITYRGARTTGDPWEVKGTPQTNTTDPAVLTGITALTNESLIVAALLGEDNNNATIATTGTDPASYTIHYDETVTGADAMVGFSEGTQSVTGATGNISVDFDVAVPVGWGAQLLALIPPLPAVVTGHQVHSVDGLFLG